MDPRRRMACPRGGSPAWLRENPRLQENDEIVVEGVLDRITYVNEENAWSVVRISLAEGGTATAVGNLLGVRPGDSLRLRGHWEVHSRHGNQFKVTRYMPVEPSTVGGIRKYLGSGLIPGIGPEMAKRLVGHFGIETLQVIEEQPQRLTEVAGIGKVRSDQIRAAWREQRGVQEVMVFLQSHGISARFAARIHMLYRDRALAVVRDNPYQLATDIRGIGFPTADRIAASIGIARDAPRRLEAGVLHQLDRAADRGHLYCPRSELVEGAVALLDVEAAPVETAVDVLLADGCTVAVDLDDGIEAVYLEGLHRAEQAVARRLAQVRAAQARPVSIDTPRAVRWFEERQGLTLAAQQRRALELAITEKVLVISGGPGTGKTTILNAVLRVLELKGYRVQLAAPTGRAAKRMQQACGHEARTIHRLLEYNPRERRFQRDERHRLETDLLIVDEMSMVDIVLFWQLLAALPDTARLVLVGDVDQLPAVGPGNVLRDLVDCGVVSVVVLDHIFRQEAASQIVINAHRVNAGEMPFEDRSADAGGDFFFVQQEDPERIVELIRELVGSRIPQRFGIDAIAGVQVLTPMQRGLLGVSNLNAELQRLLNPTGPELVRGTRLFRVGDRVMQLRNNYGLDIYNGDIGRVVGIDSQEQTLDVTFDDRTVTLGSPEQEDLTLAYASSIHKSQGSEYPAVVIPIHTSHYVMLERNLLYTAITRGRRLVVLIGSHRAVGRAVRNRPTRERNSRLAALIRDS